MPNRVCPLCGSKNIGTNGKTRGRCRACGKQWNMYHPHSKDEIFQRKIMSMMENRKIPIHHYKGEVVRFGYVTDTQIGSLYEHNNVLHLAYNLFFKEGVRTVYHTGDLCDGEKMYRGQEYETYAHGADAQVKACVSRYPKRDGMTTYFITGNHDLSFYKQAGIDIGHQIAEKRPDMVYLGQDESDVMIKTNRGKVIARLVHPGKGTAYALSYHPQKYIEALSGGQKPNILLIGHYHKAEYIPCYRNVFTLQGGCIQGQTPFMKRQNIAAHVGFWIVEFRVDQDGSIMRFKPEFFAHYEDRIIKTEVKA